MYKRQNEYCCDFTYIEDIVQANILAVLTTDPKAVNQVYNLAFEERTSLYQLAGYLKEFLSAFDKSIAGIEITMEDHSMHTQHSVTFTEKARELLGYVPRYSLRNGLLKSAGWYWAYLPQFDEEATEKKLQVLHTTTLTA